MYPWALTKAVEAAVVELSDVAGVGMVTTPVKVGADLGAYVEEADEIVKYDDIPLMVW